jgi:uncharacterized integral membrane protein
MTVIKYLRAALTLLVGALLIAFAIANRGVVAISFAPLPIELHLPLYALVLLSLALGALIGGFVVGMRSLARKREASRLKQRLNNLEHQMSVRRRLEEESLAQGRGSGGALRADLARG